MCLCVCVRKRTIERCLIEKEIACYKGSRRRWARLDINTWVAIMASLSLLVCEREGKGEQVGAMELAIPQTSQTRVPRIKRFYNCIWLMVLCIAHWTGSDSCPRKRGRTRGEWERVREEVKGWQECGSWQEWKSAELANQSSQPMPLNRLINCDKISKKQKKKKKKYTQKYQINTGKAGGKAQQS